MSLFDWWIYCLLCTLVKEYIVSNKCVCGFVFNFLVFFLQMTSMPPTSTAFWPAYHLGLVPRTGWQR